MNKAIELASYDRKSAFSYFLAYFQYKIDKEGAKQVDIAKAIHVRPEYINRVYKERQGCSVDVQEKVAQYFGSPYLEALAIGKHIRETGDIPREDKKQEKITPTSLPTEYSRSETDKYPQQDLIEFVSKWAAKNKETEAKLAKLQNIIENLSEGVVILDTDLKIEYQNRAHRDMFGGSFIGIECSTAHDCEKHICECPSSVSKRTGMPERAIFPYKKGTASALTTPIRSTSGIITGYVSVIRDITERQKLMTMAEKALELLDRAVLVYDDKEYIRFHNSELQYITGASDKDLVTLDTFTKFLAENKIIKNHKEVVKLIKQAKDKRIESNIKTHFNSGATYDYRAKPMYIHDSVYIGRMGVFNPVI